MKNRGVIKSELRSDGSLAITVTGDNVWMTRSEIVEFLGVFQQSFIANLKEVLKSGELREEDVVYVNKKGATLYNLDVVLALIFRCRGGYCHSIRGWIKHRIKKPIVEHRQPIIITLPNCDTPS